MSNSPSCEGRLPSLCETSFPSVTNYDYENNYFTRGINDRAFRWGDVSVDSSWLFVEATRSGDFENNSFASIGGVTGVTGRWYVTTGSVAQTAAYSPWNVSGGYTIYVPTSGTVLTPYNLVNYTGSTLLVHPIQGNQSIAMHCVGPSTPKIYCDPMPVSPTGITIDQNHQVYMVARCNYHTGVQPYLRAVVSALSGSNVLGYYNHVSSTWAAAKPTGFFTVRSDGYTEIKYNFTATDASIATCSGYVLTIESECTGSIITVDDIHVDQYMERNAFVSGIVPNGYVVQISPDLGWHNKNYLLDQNDTYSNPFAKTVGPFTTILGNLQDNLDGSVTALLSQSEMESATYERFKKYVWRALPIAPNGGLGQSTETPRFEYIGKDLDSDFLVTNVIDSPTSTEKIIVGTKSPRMLVVVDGNTAHPGVTYTSPTDWKLIITVIGQKQVVEVYGQDNGGATSSSQFLELSNSLYVQAAEPLWNTFDEHGVLFDIKRIPNENNSDFAARMTDLVSAPGGSTHGGVVNGGTRELGILKIDDALSLTIPKDTRNVNIHSSVDVEFGSVYFRARTPTMIKRETVHVDSVYQTAILTKMPYDKPILVVTDLGVTIPLSKVEIISEEDFPSIRKLKINQDSARGRHVTVEYYYYEEILYKNYPTIGQLQDQINTLVDNAGLKLITCKSSMLLAGGEDCLGLFIDSFVISKNESARLPWSPLMLRRISDKFFREYYAISGESFRETEFYSYVTELQSNSRTLWGTVQADRDYWDAADSTSQSFDHIPTLLDPKVSVYYSNNLQIDGQQAWGRSYVGSAGETILNKGINNQLFQPGVAHTNDLIPDVAVFDNVATRTSDIRLSTSPIKQDNNYVIFSGQS